MLVAEHLALVLSILGVENADLHGLAVSQLGLLHLEQLVVHVSLDLLQRKRISDAHNLEESLLPVLRSLKAHGLPGGLLDDEAAHRRVLLGASGRLVHDHHHDAGLHRVADVRSVRLLVEELLEVRHVLLCVQHSECVDTLNPAPNRRTVSSLDNETWCPGHWQEVMLNVVEARERRAQEAEAVELLALALLEKAAGVLPPEPVQLAVGHLLIRLGAISLAVLEALELLDGCRDLLLFLLHFLILHPLREAGDPAHSAILALLALRHGAAAEDSALSKCLAVAA
mmetsp:Transcript_22215/g.87519  ORF Transcript_22215/g.87519 Transcript_22215/m.87519 type:complete len:284 (-) Transcript_22215:2825-3676(-)